MTIVTGIAAGNVGGILAGRDIAVVAGLTGADDLGVIHHGGRRPKIDAMAVFADRSRCYVAWVFAGRVAAVMAARTIARDSCMVKVGRGPCDGGVAIIAIVATRKMGRMLAGRGHAVMTRATAAEYLCVVHRVRWRKGHRVVAVLADIGGLHVRWVFPSCIGTVMAARAIARDIDVIKICRNPAGSGMTVVTAVAARNVGGVLASRSIAIMTGAAAAYDISMVDRKCRCEAVGCVAVLAGVGR